MISSKIIEFDRNKIKYSIGIDTIKSLAIVMVIMYHCSSFYMADDIIITMLMCICSCCVPMFFMVNGYLVLSPPLTDMKRHVRKIIKLLILIAIWSSILTICILLIKGESITLKIIIHKITSRSIGYCNYVWFLDTIFMLYLIKPALSYCLNNREVYTYLLEVVTIMTIILPTSTIIFFCISDKIDIYYITRNINIFYGWPSFALFYFMGGIILNNIKTKKFFLIVAILSFMIAIIVTILMKNPTYDPVWSGYSTIWTAIMSIFLCTVCLKMKWGTRINKTIKVIGSNTLGIYLIEAIIIAYLKEVITPTNSLLIYLGITIVVLFISTIVTIYLRKLPLINKIFII